MGVQQSEAVSFHAENAGKEHRLFLLTEGLSWRLIDSSNRTDLSTPADQREHRAARHSQHRAPESGSVGLVLKSGRPPRRASRSLSRRGSGYLGYLCCRDFRLSTTERSRPSANSFRQLSGSKLSIQTTQLHAGEKDHPHWLRWFFCLARYPPPARKQLDEEHMVRHSHSSRSVQRE